jgi:hypothetical protein
MGKKIFVDPELHSWITSVARIAEVTPDQASSVMLALIIANENRLQAKTKTA